VPPLYAIITIIAAVLGLVVAIAHPRIVKWVQERRSAWAPPHHPGVYPWRIWPELPSKGEGLCSFGSYVQELFPPRAEIEACLVCRSAAGRQNRFYIWQTEVDSNVQQLPTWGGLALGLSTGFFFISRKMRYIRFVSCHRICPQCRRQLRWRRLASFSVDLAAKLMMLVGILVGLGLLLALFIPPPNLPWPTSTFFLAVCLFTFWVGFCVAQWAELLRHPAAVGFIARDPIQRKAVTTSRQKLKSAMAKR